MKVIHPKTMQQIESLAYRDGASEQEFMENAGTGIASAVEAFIKKRGLARKVILVCGKGNNGGDAYVAGVHLLANGYDVSACQAFLFKNVPHSVVRIITDFSMLAAMLFLMEYTILMREVILDGIFGTGFHGQVEEPYESSIRAVNASKLPVIAVDIPSGLNGETGDVEGEAIKADVTVFLGLPKTGFFLKQGWNYIGRLHHVDFGLSSTYIDQAQFTMELITLQWLQRGSHRSNAIGTSTKQAMSSG